jgi:predicted metalloprotease with PDZ domain
MKRLTIAALAAIVALTTVGLVEAGDKSKKASYEAKKCDASAEECLSAMAAKIQTKGFLGIETEKDDNGRYRVTQVVSRSPAYKAGFKTGDVLLALNGASLYGDDKTELKKIKSSLSVGSEVAYTVERAGSKKVVEGTLGKVPKDVMAQWIGEHMIDQHAHIEVASR